MERFVSLSPSAWAVIERVATRHSLSLSEATEKAVMGWAMRQRSQQKWREKIEQRAKDAASKHFASFGVDGASEENW